MTPILARALLEDREWCRIKAPKAVRRLLDISKGEPRGLLLDLLRFVVTYEAVQDDLDRHGAEVAEVLEHLQGLVNDRDHAAMDMDLEIDSLNQSMSSLQKQIKGLRKSLEQQKKQNDELVDERDNLRIELALYKKSRKR